MKLSFKKILAAFLAFALMITAVQWDNLSIVKAEETGRTSVSAKDEDWQDYLLLNRYQDSGDMFGVISSSQGDLRYDYPSLYEEMYGIYDSSLQDKANRWNYIATKVNAEKDGQYRISVSVKSGNESAVFKTFGMIVDGAMYVLEVSSHYYETLNQDIYLTEGEHVIIFTTPMPREAKLAQNYATCWKDGTGGNYYPYFDMYSFAASDGLAFVSAPSTDEVKEYMTSYQRVEAENTDYVLYNKNYGTSSTVTYTTRNNVGVTTVVGASGCDISDDTVSEGETNVNTTQTYESLATYLDKKVTSYVQYAVKADEAGTYNVRIGAYVEGSGTMPYGTVLVNDKTYKAEFSGNWNGLDAVNLAVELEAGVNIIRLVGVTADQIDSAAWIGYDFLEVQKGLEIVTPGTTSILSDLQSYLVSNNYGSLTDSEYGGAVTNTIRTDLPSIETLQEDSFTKLNNWPWAGMEVSAPHDGYYDISMYIGTTASASSGQIGMLIDGEVVESKGFTIGTDAKQILNASTYLTAGEHTLLYTTPIPATQEIADSVTSDTAWKYYPWMNIFGGDSYKISLGGGLTALDPDESLISDIVGIEAENAEYVTYSDGFSVQKYPASSTGQIVTGVTSNSQLSSYADINNDYIEWDKTDSVQFAVNTEAEGNYDITLGVVATRESNDITETPKAAVLVNGNKYEVSVDVFGKVSEITIADVVLNQGNNIIMCTAATNDVAGTMISFDYFEIEEGISFVAIADLKTETVISAGDETRVLPNLYNDAGETLEDTSGTNATYTPIRNAQISLENLTTDDLNIVPYAAIKATASYSGYYDISLMFSNMRNNENVVKYANNIGMLIDGKVYPVQFSVASSTTACVSVYMQEGTHTIVFTAPMPILQETADNAEIAANNRYPWANMGNITLYGLTVEEDVCPTFTEVESHQDYIRIEAEDNESGYVIYNKYDSVDSSIIASGRKTLGGVSEGNDIKQNFTTLAGDSENQGYLVKSGMPYVQYAVNAPHTEGMQNYKIRVAFYANYSGTKPYISVLVNDTVHKVEFTGASNTIDIIELEVGLKPGINIIRCTSHTLEQTATCGWINHDFLDVDKRLTVVEQSQQTITAIGGDSALNKYAKFNSVNSDGSLSSVSAGNLRTDAPSIESLKEDGMVNLLSRWPYVAMKVDAKADGYYDISAYVDVRTDALSHQIGMFVDGEVYCLPYTDSSTNYDTTDTDADELIDASVYLTKGTHVLIFTTPMPRTNEDVTEVISNSTQTRAYPWINFDSFTLSDGLEVLELTDNELTASLKTCVEAEDETKATYNIYAKESNSSASNGYVVGGVTKTNLIQSLEDASKYMDKYSTPYVQYAINAPEDGTYLVNVRAYVGGSANDDYALTDVAVPYVGVWVNGESTKAQFSTWNAFNNAVVELKLKEGINYVRVMGLTTEQGCVSKISCYVNHDYIELESGLTVVGVSELTEAQEFNAAESDTILSNNYEINGTGLGDADCDDMKYDRVSVESLANSDLGRVAYAAVKVYASENGYYDFAMNILAKSDTDDYKISKQVGMVVDGGQVNPAYLKGDGTAHTIGSTIYLEKGTHIVVFTSPLPMDNKTADALYYPGVGATDGWSEMNFAYPWCNYNTITIDGRLKVETAPLEDEVSKNHVLIGDANDDGELDAKDDETLRAYMVGLQVEINLDAADVTGTGVYDCKNLVALIKVVENAAISPTAYVSDHRAMLTRQNADYITTYSVDDLDESTGTVIEINTETTKHEVHGFGASFTDSSALVLSQMSDDSRENILTSLFDEEKGIGLSMIRNTIGSSDFSTEYYTYQDEQNVEFALAGGQTENILKYTQRALEINSDTKVFLAPWSAPLWMKTGASAKASDYPGTDEEWKYTSASGATVNENYYSAYAQYLANTVKAYEEDYNIPVYAISAQNEPFTNNYWPGTNWGQDGNTTLKLKWIDFISNHFNSAIKNVSSDTLILNLDYNFYNANSASLLKTTAPNATDAIAFHWYKGEPEAMEAFDDLMYVTEASSSYSDNNTTSQIDMTQKIVRSLRSGSSGFIAWNIALYPEGGPTLYDINEQCSPLVTYDYNDVDDSGVQEIVFTKDYYALAHFSKFMDTNAVVVESTNTAKTSTDEDGTETTSYDLVNVVTKNPDDGSMTAVIVNSDSNESKICKLVSDGKVMEVNVAPRSTVTITWNPNN